MECGIIFLEYRKTTTTDNAKLKQLLKRYSKSDKKNNIFEYFTLVQHLCHYIIIFFLFFLCYLLSEAGYHYSRLGPWNCSSEEFCGTHVEPFGIILEPFGFFTIRSSAVLDISSQNELQQRVFLTPHDSTRNICVIEELYFQFSLSPRDVVPCS